MLDSIVNVVFGFFFACILGRTLLSYIVPMTGNRPHPTLLSAQRFVFQVTEPLLGPIRRYLTFGVFDFSPMVVLIVLIIVWKRLV
ncbi:MAG: hypothetical protein BZY81_06565 [SAR202 cluster bacterium Io17-Chloro-G4]|nr:MAG: hypothetical protein BZY81_06565 [SAR202 cluster bacterium Io17-Chloro-G4]